MNNYWGVNNQTHVLVFINFYLCAYRPFANEHNLLNEGYCLPGRWLGHECRLIEVICVNPINASWIPAKAEALEGNTAV